MWARVVSLLLGVWLMISVFFWPHTPTEWMFVGVYWAWALIVMSAAAFVEPRVRYGAALLGVVLAVYAILAHHAVGFTRWHDFAVGMLFVVFSTVPSAPLTRHQVKPERRIST